MCASDRNNRFYMYNAPNLFGCCCVRQTKENIIQLFSLLLYDITGL